MGWLLELLVEGIREMLSQFVIDMMTLVTDMFTELLSCDLSLFEELFSVVGDLYTNVMLPMGIALLLLICVWQLFKSMFGKAGVDAALCGLVGDPRQGYADACTVLLSAV